MASLLLSDSFCALGYQISILEFEWFIYIIYLLYLFMYNNCNSTTTDNSRHKCSFYSLQKEKIMKN